MELRKQKEQDGRKNHFAIYHIGILYFIILHFLFTYILLGKTYFLQPFLFRFVATSCFVICTRTRLFSYMLDIRQERYYATLITWGLVLIYCLQVGQAERFNFYIN